MSSRPMRFSTSAIAMFEIGTPWRPPGNTSPPRTVETSELLGAYEGKKRTSGATDRPHSLVLGEGESRQGDMPR
jgi:hypothetical protein